VCCRESLAQLMEAGKRVVDSPIHLADFGERHLQIQSDILCGITLAARSCDMTTSPRKKIFFPPSLGAALTSAESHQLQAVLECTNVMNTFAD